MKLLILCILLLDLNSKDFTMSQKEIMYKTYYTAKKFNLGYTMAAIAWQESQFGKYKINLSDPSCGVFHTMPKYLSKNKWSQSRLCERLIVDYDFSFSTALEQLKYWENYWASKGVARVWSHTVVSYNQGYIYNANSKYLRDIKAKIKILKSIIK